MTSTKELLVHMTGYATIALILGTANWSMIGWAFALPIALATLLLAGWMFYRHLLARASSATAAPNPEVAADE